MRNHYSIILAFILMFVLIGASAQANNFIKRQQAIEDIDSLIFYISEIHPNMFFHRKEKGFRKNISHIKKNLPDSICNIEFYKMLCPLITSIGDGHTTIQMPQEILQLKDGHLFPLLVEPQEKDHSLITLANMFGVPKGVRILSVNGIKSQTLIESMLPYCDGDVEFYKMAMLTNAFSPLMNLLYPGETYNVEYQRGKDVKTTTLKGVTPNELLAAISNQMNDIWLFQRFEEPYSYRIIDNNVGLLTYASCEEPEKMGVFADAAVADMKKHGVKELIIDLRLNGGGNSEVGDSLLRRISKVPFMFRTRSIRKITPTTLRMANNAGLGLHYTFAPGVYEQNIAKDSANYNLPLPESRRFNGRVWMLISHCTYSSGADCATAFKEFHMGKVVGQETGGMNACYIDVLPFQLSHSGLRGWVSHKYSENIGFDGKHVHGVLPDHEVPAQDALKYTLELIKEK